MLLVVYIALLLPRCTSPHREVWGAFGVVLLGCCNPANAALYLQRWSPTRRRESMP